jgi:hypothetical protein
MWSLSAELFESQIIAQRESNPGNQIIFMIYYHDLLQYRDINFGTQSLDI